MRYTPNETAVGRAFFVSSLALGVFFSVFIWASNNCKPNLKFLNFDFSRVRKVEVTSFALMSLLVLPLGLYSTISTIGGIHSDAVGMELINGIRVHTKSTGYIADAKNVLFGYVILAVFVFRFKWYSFIPFLAFIAHRAFIGYGRWGIILSVISLLVIYLYKSKSHWPKKQWVILVPLFFLLFNVIGHNRDYIRGFFEEVDQGYNVYEQEGFNSLDTLDFANFDYLTFIVDVIPEKTNEYRYGAHYLQLFTEPIPRIFWHSKPFGEPIKFYDLNDYGNFLGLTYSLPGDGWSSGGYIGVVVTIFIFAFLIGRYYSYFCKNLDSPNVVCAYATFFPILIQLYRDGGISVFKFMLFVSFPILIYTMLHNNLLRSFRYYRGVK